MKLRAHRLRVPVGVASLAVLIACDGVLAPATAFAEAAAEDARPRIEVLATGGARDLLTGTSDNLNNKEHPMSTDFHVLSAGGAMGLAVVGEKGWGVLGLRYEVGATGGGLRTHLILLDISQTALVTPGVTLFMGPRCGEVLVERATTGSVIEHWGLLWGGGLAVGAFLIVEESLTTRRSVRCPPAPSAALSHDSPATEPRRELAIVPAALTRGARGPRMPSDSPARGTQDPETPSDEHARGMQGPRTPRDQHAREMQGPRRPSDSPARGT
jgi:hypothetical protein